MRSGLCCTTMLAVVPKYGNSNLDSEFLETMSEDKADQYFSENSELMGTPCKWLDRDQLTTEATCKVHIQRGDECRNYPEAFKKDQWCTVGLDYWSSRMKSGMQIPQWIEKVINEGHK
nr:YkgJ family cysteine cluster protein [Paenibacillus periandrae]